MHALWPHHPEAPGICVPPPLRVRSACSPEELAAGDLVGALLLGWPESPGLLPSLRLRFLQGDMRTVRLIGRPLWWPKHHQTFLNDSTRPMQITLYERHRGCVIT